MNWKVSWWKVCANPECKREFLDKNQKGRTLCKTCSDYKRNHVRLPDKDDLIMLTGVHQRRVRAPSLPRTAVKEVSASREGCFNDGHLAPHRPGINALPPTRTRHSKR